MKKLILIAAIALSGCSVIFPIAHDPVMFGDVVDVRLELNRANCQNKDWTKLYYHAERVAEYATLREDPQADSLRKLLPALDTAHKSKNEKFCESVLSVQRTRIAVVIDAWRGR